MVPAGDRDSAAGSRRRTDGILDAEPDQLIVVELGDAELLVREGAMLGLRDLALHIACADLSDARIEFVDGGRMGIPGVPKARPLASPRLIR